MYTHLTQEQRNQVSLLLRLGYSQRGSALVLGISPSTICRELQRNSGPSGGYHAASARVLKRARRAQANALRNKLLSHPRLVACITRKLQADYSPEQIVGWFKSSGAKLRACVQTIYDWIYLYARHLLKHLHCRKGKYRRTRENSLRKSFRNKLKEVRSIDARPIHIAQRKTYGHWEGDTVVGTAQSGSIATFVERKSGYLMAALLPDKTAKSFEIAAKQCFDAVPSKYTKTLTLDNGVEMSNYEKIERTTNIQIYFAHPYHSWERGTNENTNGLLRFYFPKKMSFAHLTQETLDEAVKRINTRPRKRLDYKTPERMFKAKW
jgi:IS30 family transposase